jgi:hypothetical protein
VPSRSSQPPSPATTATTAHDLPVGQLDAALRADALVSLPAWQFAATPPTTIYRSGTRRRPCLRRPRAREAYPRPRGLPAAREAARPRPRNPEAAPPNAKPPPHPPPPPYNQKHGKKNRLAQPV